LKSLHPRSETAATRTCSAGSARSVGPAGEFGWITAVITCPARMLGASGTSQPGKDNSSNGGGGIMDA